MSRPDKAGRGWVVGALAAALWLGFCGGARSGEPPAPPVRIPPADMFRRLLAAPPLMRESWLAAKPPAARELIREKLAEFTALPPEDRELRLRVAELEYYLTPLLAAATDRREAILAAAPADLQPLLKDRLKAWDALPEAARREVLDSHSGLSGFVSAENADPARLEDAVVNASPSDRVRLTNEFLRWSALPAEDRARKTAGFQRFFALDSVERDKVLQRLAESDRRAMELTLAAFARLSPAQRERCVTAFGRLGAMPAEERDRFLHDAARWEALPSRERESWRNLVAQLRRRPPTPPPPMPPRRSPVLQVAATNAPGGSSAARSP